MWQPQSENCEFSTLSAFKGRAKIAWKPKCCQCSFFSQGNQLSCVFIPQNQFVNHASMRKRKYQAYYYFSLQCAPSHKVGAHFSDNLQLSRRVRQWEAGRFDEYLIWPAQIPISLFPSRSLFWHVCNALLYFDPFPAPLCTLSGNRAFEVLPFLQPHPPKNLFSLASHNTLEAKHYGYRQYIAEIMNNLRWGIQGRSGTMSFFWCEPTQTFTQALTMFNTFSLLHYSAKMRQA